MYVAVWKFVVRQEHLDRFRHHYGPEGSWVELFRSSPAYIRTELLQDDQNPAHFLTLDYWQTKDEYVQFRSDSREAYENLDREFERLTVSEERIGDFTQGAS